jgi:poly-gamma-glutamate capsule biosynthesis protein CapA/YwtB (metallophosphatase superfamily)
LEDNIRLIKGTKIQADFVFVSLHHHGPEELAVEFAHSCLDAGADAFIGHGPHSFLGIEVYNKRPIFYGLGSFIFHRDRLRKIAQEAYDGVSLDSKATAGEFNQARSVKYPHPTSAYQSIVPKFTLENGKLLDLRIYPITLGYNRPMSKRGDPALADQTLGREIIENLQQKSLKFGTKIKYEDGMGVIET